MEDEEEWIEKYINGYRINKHAIKCNKKIIICNEYKNVFTKMWHKWIFLL